MSLPVSVIVPIFNQGDYALRAIDSLCAQTYDNLQIIVVDDGSSDGSAKRVRQHFGAKITLLEQENAGPSAALNAGLRIAQGTSSRSWAATTSPRKIGSPIRQPFSAPRIGTWSFQAPAHQ